MWILVHISKSQGEALSLSSMESPLEVWRILIIGCFLEYFPMPSMPASRKVYTTTILRLQSFIHLSTTFPPRFSNSRDQFLTESELSAQIPFQMLRGGRTERKISDIQASIIISLHFLFSSLSRPTPQDPSLARTPEQPACSALLCSITVTSTEQSVASPNGAGPLRTLWRLGQSRPGIHATPASVEFQQPRQQ